jgi:hypothetical protein
MSIEEEKKQHGFQKQPYIHSPRCIERTCYYVTSTLDSRTSFILIIKFIRSSFLPNTMTLINDPWVHTHMMKFSHFVNDNRYDYAGSIINNDGEKKNFSCSSFSFSRLHHEILDLCKWPSTRDVRYRKEVKRTTFFKSTYDLLSHARAQRQDIRSNTFLRYLTKACTHWLANVSAC